jgi:hypothetical protein
VQAGDSWTEIVVVNRLADVELVHLHAMYFVSLHRHVRSLSSRRPTKIRLFANGRYRLRATAKTLTNLNNRAEPFCGTRPFYMTPQNPSKPDNSDNSVYKLPNFNISQHGRSEGAPAPRTADIHQFCRFEKLDYDAKSTQTCRMLYKSMQKLS